MVAAAVSGFQENKVGLLEWFEFAQYRRAARSEVAGKNDALRFAVFLDNQLNARGSQHMTRIVPDRFDPGSCLKLLLIRDRSQLGENFLGVFRSVERRLRRFARALPFPIAPFVVRDLPA